MAAQEIAVLVVVQDARTDRVIPRASAFAFLRNHILPRPVDVLPTASGTDRMAVVGAAEHMVKLAWPSQRMTLFWTSPAAIDFEHR